VRVALLAALSALAAAAGPAAAATTIHPSIKGAGTIQHPDGGTFDCPDARLDDRLEALECSEFTTADPLFAQVLRAFPRPTPPGHWEARWEGCPLPQLDPAECGFAAGPTDTTYAPVAVFDDVKAPTIGEVTEIRPGPAGTVTFQFTADEDADDGAGFACRLDAAAPADCTSGSVTYTGVPPGTHAFHVEGTDASGNVGAGSKPFTIDAPAAAVPPTAPKPPFVPLIPRVLGPSTVVAKVSRNRTFALGRVRLVCPAVSTPCPATARLRGRLRRGGKLLTVARKSELVRPATAATVRLRLSRKVAAALRQRGRLRATATLEIRAPDVTTRKDVAVTLRPPKRR
jgi:hypothetical protein